MYPHLKHGSIELDRAKSMTILCSSTARPPSPQLLYQAAVADHCSALQEVADEGAQHTVDQELREAEEVGLHDAHQGLKQPPWAAPGVHPFVSVVVVWVIVWVAAEKGENIR